MGENKVAKSPFTNKLNHVGIVVRDMDKAVARLESLGIGPFENPPALVGKPVFWGKPSDAMVKGLIARVGEVDIELTEPVEGETPQQEFMDAKGEGIHHIGFLVDDLDREVSRFTEQGISVMLSGEGEGEKWAYFDIGVAGLILQLTKRS